LLAARHRRDVDSSPAEVVTVYVTHKLSKYGKNLEVNQVVKRWTYGPHHRTRSSGRAARRTTTLSGPEERETSPRAFIPWTSTQRAKRLLVSLEVLRTTGQAAFHGPAGRDRMGLHSRP